MEDDWLAVGLKIFLALLRGPISLFPPERFLLALKGKNLKREKEDEGQGTTYSRFDRSPNSNA